MFWGSVARRMKGYDVFSCFVMQYLALAIIIFCFSQANSCLSSEENREEISLIAAVKKGEFEKVSAYLRQGEDPNSRDAYGTPLLHWACYCDKKNKIIEALLKAGAKIDAKDIDGWIPFDWADANPSAMKQLIQKAIDLRNLTIRGHDGKTLLHYAAALDNKESNKIVEQLLALPLDPNAKDNYGRTPLDLAIRKDVIIQLSLVTNNPIASKL